MAALYPGSLDSFTPKTDGPAQKIMAAHVNDLQNSVVAIETELGTDPAGSLVDLKTRLAVMLTAAGGLIGPERIKTVAKSGASYTTIQSAINAISDAAANKIYTVLVFPGEYNEAITLKNYVDIIAIDPESTKILQQVTDNESTVHCYLNINIYTSSGSGLLILSSDSVILFKGDIHGYSYAVSVSGATIKITGNLTAAIYSAIESIDGNVTFTGTASVVASHIMTIENGSLNLINTSLSTTYNNIAGYGIRHFGGTLICRDTKIICTHASTKSIYASSAQNARCMSVWANRDDDANITQLITGGFTFDANVQ